MSENEIQGVVAHVFEECGLAPYVKKSDNNAELSLLMQNCQLQLGRILSDNHLSLNAYQKGALETAIYPDYFKVIYPALGITGEAGEVSDKVKKLIRDTDYTGGKITDASKREDLALELGDVLWYVATLSNDLDYSLEQIAEMNYQKLRKRKEQGKIGGSGDHRQDTHEKSAKTYHPHDEIDRSLFLTTLGVFGIVGIIIGIAIGMIF